MKRIVALLLLLSLTVLVLPKELFHHHEEKTTYDSGTHFDEDCFACDLDLSLFETTVGVVLSLMLVRFTADFLIQSTPPVPVYIPASNSRGPPAFS
jgi:hypothetical protein